MTQPPPRSREQIAAEIEAERQQLGAAVGGLRKSGGDVAKKAKRTLPLVAVVVSIGGFLATSAFLATLRFLWRRVRG